MGVLTRRYDTSVDCIAHDVMVCQSKKLCSKTGLSSKEELTVALWDTGAGKSGISKSLANKLNLVKLNGGKSETKKGASGSYESFSYFIDILLSPDMQISNVEVFDFIDNGKFDILISMDIITMGDMAITQDRGETVFSFVVPSLNEPIDFGKKLGKQ